MEQVTLELYSGLTSLVSLPLESRLAWPQTSAIIQKGRVRINAAVGKETRKKYFAITSCVLFHSNDLSGKFDGSTSFKEESKEKISSEYMCVLASKFNFLIVHRYTMA